MGHGVKRLIKIVKSAKPEKKFDAYFEMDNGRVKRTSFGAAGMSNYTRHKNSTRKQRYLTRHGGMKEDWSDPTTAGALSRWVLWNKTGFRASIADFKRRFGI
jgi:hypothetical protein